MNSKWLLPLTVFGVGSLSLLVLSDRGMDMLEWLIGRMKEAPQRFLEWNEAAQHELDRIELVLDRMAESYNVAQ